MTIAAADVPSQEQAGGVQARQDLQDREKNLRDEVRKGRAAVPVEQPSFSPESQAPEGEKVIIRKIEVTGVTLFPASRIRSITSGYENKELSLRGMQEVAARITDLYRQRGYITSRAILPPQRVEGNTLKVDVIEGRMGKVDVRGNKYFKASLIQKKISLRSGSVFDYNRLKTDLAALNESRDRQVKTVLLPGQQPGTTDILLNVKDRLPIHFGVSYDNYGSRYLDKKRYQGSLTHNNLTGHDDAMTLTYQRAEGHNTYRLSSARYVYPLSAKTQIGFFVANTQLQLGREFADLVARGKSKVYSVYLTRSLFSNDRTEISFDTGFDYKDVHNFQLYDLSSKDRLRVARLGFKVDHSDAWSGRTVINNEVSQGIPNKWGALDDKESAFVTSRAGAGGKFTKNVIDIVRLQRTPWSTTLLLRGQAQHASHVLTATEQYQLGGIANLRGFAPGEAVGDNGASASAEWNLPFYGLSKRIKVPFSKAMLYDALRWVVFYDCGKVSFRRASAGEQKTRTLSDYGVGLRYDLPENFSVRIDVAWPINETPSDRGTFHTWFKISKEF